MVLVCLLAHLEGNAQKINKLNNPSSKLNGIERFFKEKAKFKAAKSDQSYYLILKFDRLPNTSKSRMLHQKNIILQNYLGNNSFIASIPSAIKPKDFKKLGVIDIRNIPLQHKMSVSLKERNYPTWVLNNGNRINIAVIFYEGLSKEKITNTVSKFGFQKTAESLQEGMILIGSIEEDKIISLAANPIVAFIDLQQEPDKALNYENRCLQGITSISSNIAGSKNLNGTDVCIGIGDGGELGKHLDFTGRIAYSVDGKYASFGDHGDHVAGIIAGAGLINPRHKGIAPKASLLIEKTSRITTYLPDYFNNYGMVITNNSYGTSFDCASNGAYNYSSLSLDKQLLDYPETLHLFAAGNSGGGTCVPYPIGYKTVLKYYQSAKNVLTVGVVDEDKLIWSSSSRGPVLDGRLKPEICGVGKYVRSTGNNYNYNKKSGSSMAAPAVAGTIGLMYEQYRKLNNGNNPEGALMKAIACNTAEDLGNKGPDYIYGYGLINGRRAVELIEDAQFFSGNISTGDFDTETINVPAGTKQSKVMLYWHDKEASAYPNKALVNDLDLEMKNPSNQSFLPWVLNPAAANVADLAQRGVDTLNNIEQITIDNPQAGAYEIKVKGSSIPFGPQRYHIVYEFVSSEIVVLHPFGGEVFEPNATEKIVWDTDNTNTEKFTAEYSIDNGVNWITIDADISPNLRMIDWTVPIIFSDKTLVRVSKNGTSTSDVSNSSFTILQTPTNFKASPRCEGYIKLEWIASFQATAFELFHFNGTAFVSIGTTTEESFTVDNNLTIGERQWFAIKAISSTGAYSARSIAIAVTPELDGVCPWEDDVELKSVEFERRGRAYTSSALSNQEQVFANVFNLGENTINNFELNFQLNKGAIIQQNVSFPFNSGDSLQVNLSPGLDFSSIGNYQVDAWTKLSGDIHNDNDSIIGQLSAVQLDNPVISLPMRYEFLAGITNTYTMNRMGLDGLEAWDFETEGYGSLEVDPIAGEMLILPTDPNEISTNSLILTANLSAYDAASTDSNMKIKFDYKFKEASFPSSGAVSNKVWLRGSDQDTWVELILLEPTNNFNSLLISNIGLILSNNGQNFSSSTQVRFSQKGLTGLVLSAFNIEIEVSLPVELAYFKAYKSDENAWLIWKTATEIENAYFEVQVAEGEAQLQNENFRTIGQLPGVGTISSEQIYEFWDREPNKKGTRYYRLKQVDLDGSYTYTDNRVLDFGEEHFNQDQLVYPNPFYDELKLKYYSSQEETIRLILSDVQGKTVQEMKLPIEVGDNNINISITRKIPAGVYQLRLISASNKPQKSFTIVKQQF